MQENEDFEIGDEYLESALRKNSKTRASYEVKASFEDAIQREPVTANMPPACNITGGRRWYRGKFLRLKRSEAS